MVTVAIQESFLPYVYLVIWQISIVALQHVGVMEDAPIPPDAGFYKVVMRVIGNAASWVSWALSLWVGHFSGVAAGLTFFVVGFAANVLAVAFLYRYPKWVLATHVVSLPAMPLLAYLTLASIGFGQGRGLG